MGYTMHFQGGADVDEATESDFTQTGHNKAALDDDGVSYNDYLMVRVKLLYANFFEYTLLLFSA